MSSISYSLIRVSAVVAHDKNRLIGKNATSLPWKMSDDLKRFKELTVGKVCVVGRTTLDSMPMLTDRKFVVVSARENAEQHAAYDEETVVVTGDVQSALMLAKTAAANQDQTEIFVIGGGSIYEQTFPFINRVYVTEIDAEIYIEPWDRPVYFPKMSPELWLERRDARQFITADVWHKNEYDASLRVFDRVYAR